MQIKFKKRRPSVNQQHILNLLVSCVVVVLFLGIIVLTYKNFNSFSKETTLTYAVENPRIFSNRIESIFLKMENAAIIIEDTVYGMLTADIDNKSVVNAVQKKVLRDNSFIVSIRLVIDNKENKFAQIAAKTNTGLIFENCDEFMSSDFFINDWKSRSVQLTEARDYEHGNSIYSYIRPIWDQDYKQVGMVYIDVAEEYIMNTNLKIRPLDSETCIVDSSGHLVTKTSDTIKNLNLTSLLEDTLKFGYTRSDMIESADFGKTYFVVSYPINTLDSKFWSYIVIKDTSVLFKKLYETNQIILQSIAFLFVFLISYGIYLRWSTAKYYIDPLTQVKNRYYMEQFLPRIVRHNIRRKIPFAVVMADIDHFKTINDTHGHQVGDVVLAHIANTFQSSLRKKDICLRYGGEEFLIFLFNIDSQDAFAITERIRTQVENSPCPVAGFSVKITASFGVAVPDYDTVYVGYEHLVSLADANLYKAKDCGRNRTIL